MKNKPTEINTVFLERCVLALEEASNFLQKTKKDSLDYDIYRSATIKEFEIILEQSGKLLKKCLKPYFHSSKEIDKLTFKSIFKQAGHHGLLNLEEVKRWLEYRDNRNFTSHDHGVDLAVKTLPLLPQFILDARSLIQVIKNQQEKNL